MGLVLLILGCRILFRLFIYLFISFIIGFTTVVHFFLAEPCFIIFSLQLNHVFLFWVCAAFYIRVVLSVFISFIYCPVSVYEREGEGVGGWMRLLWGERRVEVRLRIRSESQSLSLVPPFTITITSTITITITITTKTYHSHSPPQSIINHLPTSHPPIHSYHTTPPPSTPTLLQYISSFYHHPPCTYSTTLSPYTHTPSISTPVNTLPPYLPLPPPPPPPPPSGR